MKDVSSAAYSSLKHVTHDISLCFKQNRVAAKTDIGSKGINQDAFILEPKFREGEALIGVFDGHGEYGLEIAEATKAILPEKIKEFSITLSPQAALKAGFAETQKLLVENFNEKSKTSGATATLVWLCSDRAYIANVGDSSACLIKMRKDSTINSETFLKSNFTYGELVSTDHRPELSSERERVEKAGGLVVNNRYGKDTVSVGPYRILRPNLDSPGLMITRSFGDVEAHEYCGCISEPDVQVHRWTHRDALLVVATDGLWDVLDYKTLGHICQDLLLNTDSPEIMAEELLKKAIEAKSGVDNTTVIVININDGKNKSNACNIL
uniref:PPM-type phosphatase domain-containing protein n=1 Tax=Aplanochytrium stocchinoi TaxID=215587 RepID=A0A7S3PHU9_9STRA|mmetsp:Transcript_8151/g.10317  ORF Transcript_8151/g.10317 Transcript_8151/m.10317 type:complete len:324 (-) Transcript_8151:915-1886(-)